MRGKEIFQKVKCLIDEGFHDLQDQMISTITETSETYIFINVLIIALLHTISIMHCFVFILSDDMQYLESFPNTSNYFIDKSL